MTTDKTRFPLQLAELVGASLVERLVDVCDRIEVAGSIRRRRQFVGDIEVLCNPKAGGLDLFGEPVEGDSALDRRCLELMGQGLIEYRLNVDGVKMYGPLNKYVRHVGSTIPVDIFTTSQEQWGMALLVRTGPREFNQSVMYEFQRQGMQGHAYGGVSWGELEISCPEEQEVFNLLGWDYIPPEYRGNEPELRWRQVRHAVQEKAGRGQNSKMSG